MTHYTRCFAEGDVKVQTSETVIRACVLGLHRNACVVVVVLGPASVNFQGEEEAFYFAVQPPINFPGWTLSYEMARRDMIARSAEKLETG